MDTTKLKRLKRHVKKGDTVKVIAGNDKNKTGKILFVDTTSNRVVVEHVNMRVFHHKPTKQHPKGRRERREAPVHASNVMLADPATKQATRVGRKLNEQGKLQRYARKTGNFIE